MLDLNPIILAIPLYLVLMAVEWLLQYRQQRLQYRLNDAITNISCGITEQVAGVYFKLFGILLYSYIYQHWRIFDLPAHWLTFIVIFIGADFSYYWAHRASHRINLFWCGHVVHHQSQDYNLSVALRQGALQTFFTAPFYMPWAVLGVAPEMFILGAGLGTVYQFWIHTESIEKLGWMEKWFNTPSHHRVHHGIDPHYIDRNFAGVFILWDKLFGTFQAEQARPTYGITKPVNSWNVLYVHWLPVRNLWRDVQSCSGWRDKLRVLGYPPGWLPAYADGMQLPRQLQHVPVKKFDTASFGALQIYVMLQFGFMIAYAAGFLFYAQQLEALAQALGVCAIIVSLGVIGLVLERKSLSLGVEGVRQLLLPMLAAYVIGDYYAWLGGVAIISSGTYIWMMLHAPALAAKP